MKTYQGENGNAVVTAVNACIESCQKLAAQFERAKQNLLVELRETVEVHEKLFRLALNEAEALAWQTEYPHLLFPALATEKVQAASQWGARQKTLRQNSASKLSFWPRFIRR